MTIQNHYGQWLMGTTGEVAGNCCCGPEEVTTACSLEAPCAGGDPSMQVTIFDADYAGGDINWCGKTWTNAEVKAGKTECVCPSFYETYTYSSGGSTSAREVWAAPPAGGGNPHLNIFRSYILTGTTGNGVIIKGGDLASSVKDNFVGVTGNPISTFTSLGIVPVSILTQKATINSYRLTAQPQWLTGFYDNAGVLYSWKKGVGWP